MTDQPPTDPMPCTIGPLRPVPALLIEQADAFAQELDQQAASIRAQAAEVRRTALLVVLQEHGAPAGVDYAPARRDGKLYLEPRDDRRPT